ncbi:hypothetical protein [Paenibacillus nasutitermitis]|uniref:Uncharacterized protein n=1 Tax=Paenibacillus nasutitermitis TaxID=1652958 RepID=A0A917DR88_9BACL|nr:hypothetical protein [Paenibacillus nasutitermitis]GGD59024.1 hypothetical protein GCM10010911_16080 [Paenibacillus nasutitermitis]
MTNEKTNEEVDQNQDVDWAELVKAVHHNGLVSLKMYFDDVNGQVSNHEVYGPLFIYHVTDESGNGYACGYFLRELVDQFQNGSNPAEWMASFFFELMKTEGGKLLPAAPSNEEEAKAFIDKMLVPLCIKSVKEEFSQEQVHAGLDWNEQHGPVFEAGFPAIKDGNNVCAYPLHLLFTHLLLNRDPAELLINGLYKIKEEHGVE